MLGGDRELGQHFKQDRNAEDGGGDLGELTAKRLAPLPGILSSFEQFCYFKCCLLWPCQGVVYAKYSLGILLVNPVS